MWRSMKKYVSNDADSQFLPFLGGLVGLNGLSVTHAL